MVTTKTRQKRNTVKKTYKTPIKKVKPQEDWYISKIGKKAKVSPAEALIIVILNTYDIEYYREVSFRGFGPKCSPYRFDFWIPSMNLIIEYDGAHHLKKVTVKRNDIIKNNFCKHNRIRLQRLNKAHYQNLEQAIKKILKK